MITGPREHINPFSKTSAVWLWSRWIWLYVWKTRKIINVTLWQEGSHTGHTTHIVALGEVPFCSYLEISLWKQLRFNICFNAADRDNSRHCTAIISIQPYYPPNRHSSMMVSLLLVTSHVPCDTQILFPSAQKSVIFSHSTKRKLKPVHCYSTNICKGLSLL